MSIEVLPRYHLGRTPPYFQDYLDHQLRLLPSCIEF